MLLRRLTGTALTVLASTALLAACGGDEAAEVDPIEIGAINAGGTEVGPPIDLDLPPDPSGAFAFDQWPSACSLVSEDALRALLPQVEEVRSAGSSLDITLLGLGQGNRTETVPEAQCTTRVGFEQPGLGLDDETFVLTIQTGITAAGTPEFVERNTREPAGEPVEIGEHTCALEASGERMDCRLEKLSFYITFDFRQYAQYVRGSGSDYVVDGEVVTYQGRDDGFDAMVTDRLFVPLVTSIIDRVTP